MGRKILVNTASRYVRQSTGGVLSIRRFGGSLADAQGIIEVDKSTFGGCGYTPEYIATLESGADRCVWLAEEEQRIVGFVSAFATHSLLASRWEIDELAVRPEAQGHGLASELVRHAVQEGQRHAELSAARALVAANNDASKRVFTRNGFAVAAEISLLLYRIAGRVPRLPQAALPSARDAHMKDTGSIAGLCGCPVDRVQRLVAASSNAYSVVEDGSQVKGYIEMVRVCTLQYRGLWIESLVARSDNYGVEQALLNAAVEKGKSDPDIDEVGYLVSAREHMLYTASISEGFRDAGQYLTFVREAGAT